jgi:hypothetical protein
LSPGYAIATPSLMASELLDARGSRLNTGPPGDGASHPRWTATHCACSPSRTVAAPSHLPGTSVDRRSAAAIPHEWERWWLHIVRRAINADYLSTTDGPAHQTITTPASSTRPVSANSSFASAGAPTCNPAPLPRLACADSRSKPHGQCWGGQRGNPLACCPDRSRPPIWN